jgi:predicted O-methyltransferase YrrM
MNLFHRPSILVPSQFCAQFSPTRFSGEGKTENQNRMRELFDEQLIQYCFEHSTQPDDVLRDLERETNLSTVTPQMIAGPYQGRLLELLASMCSSRRALEIGTFTGYAAICIARGLQQDGHLDTIEINPEREALIRKYLSIAQLNDKVTLHIGDAFEIIPTLGDRFDFIMIDAGKKDNEAYFDLLVPLLDSGGLMILDNVLWGGKVISDPDDNDARAIADLNRKISRDERVDCIMLPIRDGITLIRKR